MRNQEAKSEKFEKVFDTLSEMNGRLSRIEGAIGVKDNDLTLKQ
jgi:hypothetical protein